MSVRAALLLACLSVVGTGCQATTTEAGATEPIVACSNMLHPPFSSWDEHGQPVGIEVDLIAEAAHRLGRDVRWVERPFIELLDAVARGEADVAASTIGITAERAARVSFSRSYYQTSIVALVRPGAGEPRRLAELGGRPVGADRGTTAVDAVASRLPTARPVLDRAEGRSWAEMLAAGEIDAIVLDESHADTFMAQAGVRLHVIAEPLQSERFALALHHDADELRAVIDQVIAERASHTTSSETRSR